MKRDKTRRVLRLADGKIFSSAFAAARVYKLDISGLIRASCNKIVGEVEGSRWAWVGSDLEIDFGSYEDILSRAQSIVKKTAAKSANNRKYSNRTYRSRVKPVADFLRWYMEGKSTHTILSRDLYPMYTEWISANNVSSFVSTVTGFGHHIYVWRELFHRIAGLSVTHTVTDRGRKLQVLTFSPEGADPFASVYEKIREYDRNNGKDIYGIKNFRRGHPVFCISTNEAFPSIVTASRKTKVPRDLIREVCNGDYEFASMESGEYQFRYAKWEEVDPKWLLIIRKKPLESKTIMDVDTGEIYGSAVEAAKETGVTVDMIRVSCNARTLKIKEVESQYPANWGRTYKFDYYTEEEW
jgi:hypothetical protein